jgi:hypothetical protein
VPILTAYAVVAGLMIDASPRLLVHALAGMVSWGLMTLLPRRRGTVSETPPETGLGLRLQ